LEFVGYDPDAFVPKEAVADYFVAYAKKFNAPIRTGVEVKSVTRNSTNAGFKVVTSEGEIEAKYVVAATGPFQKPAIPPVVPENSNINQLHSSDYLNPAQLPAGAVLVVGAGSSGVLKSIDRIWKAATSTRSFKCKWGLLPRSSLAFKTRFGIYLGCLA
jgi:putative flavoprotein involved in K+ transport